MEFSLNAYGVALIPLIVGVVELLKWLGLGKKPAAVAALLLGQLAAFAFVSPDDWRKAVIAGLVLGLSATGLWSAGKNTIEWAKGE